MKAEIYSPSGALKPYIKSFLFIESESELRNTILPDTAIIIAFRFRGNVAAVQDNIRNPLATAVITGLQKSTRLLNYAANTSTLLVQFKEAGVSAFFKIAAHELFGSSIPLDNFVRRSELNETEERLAEAVNNSGRISIIEQFLLAKLRAAAPEPLISKAITAIRQANGMIGIHELTRALGTSQDAFEKKFRSLVGASPKRFATTIRLRNLISRYSGEQTLTALSYDAGYFDQSHFIKDFRSFTGQNPQAFFKSSSYW